MSDTKATAAQVAALRWLIERGRTERIDSVALHVKYERASDLRPHAMRVTAWKRTSARTMNQMREAGLLRWNSLTFGGSHHRTYYDVTDAGFEAAGMERP